MNPLCSRVTLEKRYAIYTVQRLTKYARVSSAYFALNIRRNKIVIRTTKTGKTEQSSNRKRKEIKLLFHDELPPEQTISLHEDSFESCAGEDKARKFYRR